MVEDRAREQSCEVLKLEPLARRQIFRQRRDARRRVHPARHGLDERRRVGSKDLGYELASNPVTQMWHDRLCDACAP
jgi:hypothetical protein